VTSAVETRAGLTIDKDMEILAHMNAQNINNWWWLPSQEMAAG